MSAAFSATMIVGALVLQDGTNGITEASTTRKPSSPRRRRSGVVAAPVAAPHRAGSHGMVVGLARAIGVLRELLVALEPGAGQALGEHEGLERGLAHDFARQPQPLQRALAVVGVGPVVGIDQRRGGGIGAGEAHRAARARAQKGGIERDAGIAASARRPPRSPSRGRDGTGCRASAPRGRRTRSRRSRTRSRSPARS